VAGEGLVEEGRRGRVGLLGVQPVDRALGVSRGGEDGAGVAAEDLQPGGDVGRVVGAGFRGEAQVGAEEGSPEFGDEFLDRVGLGFEPAGKVTMKAVGCAGGVDGFVGAGRVVGVGVDEGGEGRQVDGVGDRPVAGDFAAVVGAEGQVGEEVVGDGGAFVVGEGRDIRGDEVVDLGRPRQGGCSRR
jgi:hypothetical protein